ncbi:hypothetical protein HYW20_05225 [Candidatus Woesearchaeota archaeon]|nr:hypothetical protein [Candidatus Woesearchaeota archaeon]
MKRARCEICGKAILVQALEANNLCGECNEEASLEDLRQKYLGVEL